MTRNSLARIAASLVAATAIGNVAQARIAPGNDTWRSSVAYLRHALKTAAPPVPGASLAVRMSTGAIYSAGFGVADLAQKLPVTTKTRFSGGSLAKQFTAFAVYSLAIQQRIDLGKSARTYLVDLSPVYDAVTVQELLWQTSGVRDYIELAAMSGQRLGDTLTPADAMGLINEQQHLNFAPGTRYNYSNSNYALLAQIVSRVTKKPFPQYIRDSIFLPLGMRDTTIFDGSIVPNESRSYWPATNGYTEASTGNTVTGDGNLITTPTDLLKWEQNVAAPALHPQAVARILEQSRLAGGTPARIGVGSGIEFDRTQGTEALRFDGGNEGFRAAAVVYPTRHIAIALFCNVITCDAPTFVTAIGDRILHVLPAPAAPSSPSPVPTSGAPAATNPTEYLGAYHSSELDCTYTIAEEGGKLVVRRRDQTVVHLEQTGPDAFDGDEWWFSKVRFARDASGRIDAMLVSSFRAALNVRFTRDT